MTDHLTFEQLCDLADGALDAGAAAVVRQHLTSCDECAAQLRALSELGHAAASLPLSVSPPGDLWVDIRGQLAPRAIAGRRRITSWRLPQLAAAAVVIAVGSSALTALVIRGAQPHTQTRDRIVSSTISVPTALPARLESAENGYTRSINALQLVLADRRDSLAPSTVATVEHSLRIADSAIAEARAALASDPANAALAALFNSNYERKIDVLRRATELAPRT